jgi:hypothetical protein
MTKPISIFFVLALSTLVAISQTNGQTMKECRITGGVGIAGATENVRSLGRDFWLQLNYKLNTHISIALEFENMKYGGNDIKHD